VAIAKKANEVAHRWYLNWESLRNALASLFMPAIAYHFQHMNRRDIKGTTRQIVLNEIDASDQAIFLAIEGQETEGSGSLQTGSNSSTLEECCDPAGVVVGSRRSRDAIIMSAN